MRLIIFGGTTEGRILADLFVKNNVHVTLFVATEYAKEIANYDKRINLISKRLNEKEMINYFEENKSNYIIDATHPFADIVTKNIKSACLYTNINYIRLIRDNETKNNLVSYVDTFDEAVNILCDVEENIFLAVGNKELERFTKIKDFSRKIFVRILPMLESLEKAINLGFKNSNIICMQGPFSEEINISMLKETNCKYLVTKESGNIGGYFEKISSGLKIGAKIIVIKKPTKEKGFTYKEILKLFKIKENSIKLTNNNIASLNFFPLFLDMKDKKILVVGGGKIAERRIEKLISVCSDITLISPNVTEKLKVFIDNKKIKFINREYIKDDLLNQFLVIAATNDRNINHLIMKEAKEKNILAIISDCQKECTCYFPAIIENKKYIAGLVSKDGNHKNLKKKAAEMRHWINE